MLDVLNGFFTCLMVLFRCFDRPEALGVVSGCIFLITLFLFIPIPFGSSLFKNGLFPHDEVRCRIRVVAYNLGEFLIRGEVNNE